MECFCGYDQLDHESSHHSCSSGGVLVGLVLEGFLKQDRHPRSSQSGRKSSRSSWNMEMDIYNVWSSYGALCLVVPKCSESCWEDVVVNITHADTQCGLLPKQLTWLWSDCGLSQPIRILTGVGFDQSLSPGGFPGPWTCTLKTCRPSMSSCRCKVQVSTYFWPRGKDKNLVGLDF